MVSILLYLTQAVTPAPVTTSVAQDDIVVIGERLKGWSGRVRDTIGVKTCRTTKSTGDTEIDRIGCRALSECLTKIKPQMTAAYKAAGSDKEMRRALMIPVNRAFGSCTAERREALINDLVTLRGATAKR